MFFYHQSKGYGQLSMRGYVARFLQFNCSRITRLLHGGGGGEASWLKLPSYFSGLRVRHYNLLVLKVHNCWNCWQCNWFALIVIKLSQRARTLGSQKNVSDALYTYMILFRFLNQFSWDSIRLFVNFKTYIRNVPYVCIDWQLYHWEDV
jgi:hypothetical protein